MWGGPTGIYLRMSIQGMYLPKLINVEPNIPPLQLPLSS